MLRAQITDLDGKVLATVNEHRGIEYGSGLNEARTAKVTLSVHDDRCKHLRPLDRMLRVYYHDFIIFWGVILTLGWQLDSEDPTVEVNAHDQTIWWKKNYLRYGDIAVDYGLPVDGRGIRYLHEAAIPLPHQLARGVRHPGILWGVEQSTKQGPKPKDLNNPKAGDGLWVMGTRGQNVWEAITSLTEAAVGPEWNLRPLDKDHPGVNSTWKPGFFAELNTYDYRGNDFVDEVFFQRGFGRNNLDSFVWTPDGDAVANYAVVVAPGGERSRADAKHKALSHSESSWKQYGIYEVWESSQNEDPKAVLQEKANAFVKAYSRPLNTFSITPSPERSFGPALGVGDPYRYIFNFTEGDTIRAAAKVGKASVDLAGRIMKVGILTSPEGITSTTLECVPDLTVDLSAVDDGG